MKDAGKDVRVTRSVVVDAPVQQVWDLVITPEGIDHELRPLLSMTMPDAYRGATIATVPVGERLGRAWLRLGGVLPVDYDDLHLVSVDPPHSFHERSTMLSARVWEHRRSLADTGDGRTRVTDDLRMVPRVPLPSPLRTLVGRALDALFGHRHRRLRAALAPEATP